MWNESTLKTIHGLVRTAQFAKRHPSPCAYERSSHSSLPLPVNFPPCQLLDLGPQRGRTDPASVAPLSVAKATFLSPRPKCRYQSRLAGDRAVSQSRQPSHPSSQEDSAGAVPPSSSPLLRSRSMMSSLVTIPPRPYQPSTMRIWCSPSTTSRMFVLSVDALPSSSVSATPRLT